MRAFFAVEIPPDARREADAAARDLAQRTRAFALARAEGLHVTLAFLGEIDAGAAERATRLVAGALQEVPPFRMRLGEAGWFPPHGAPRVAWIGALDGAVECADLSRRVTAAAAEAGLAVDLRAPHVHVTVGRARGRLGAHDRAALEAWRERWSRAACGAPFEVTHARLYESVRGPGGSVYAERAAAALAGAR